MRTILLLIFSNVFMTFAWYGHLKYGHAWPLWKVIAASWAIALIEYCLAVPANRLGYGQFSGFQLKIIQEVVTLVVFAGFAVMFLKEKLAWNYLVAFAFLGGAAFFAFAFQAPAPADLGRHASRFRRIRGHVPERETRVELSGGVRLSWRGRVLRLCVPGARAGRPERPGRGHRRCSLCERPRTNPHSSRRARSRQTPGPLTSLPRRFPTRSLPPCQPRHRAHARGGRRARLRQFRSATTTDKYLLVVHGTAAEVAKSHAIIERTKPISVELHGRVSGSGREIIHPAAGSNFQTRQQLPNIRRPPQ